MNDRDLKIKGLQQGASDYITKPFDPEELVARVKVHLKIKNLQDDLKRTNELLLELSNTDHLTGLFNRRYLMEALEKEVQRSVRKGGNLSLIMLDIDHFKQVNDTYGHLQGDIVLQKVSVQLQKELRSYDVAARYGGEEFIAVLPDATIKEAAFVADRVRMSIQKAKFSGALSKLSLTVSLGVALFSPESNTSVDGFIKLADDALYRAKSGGRNRVECA
jgi:diguanylate cyclase (GGDEF)-like protein